MYKIKLKLEFKEEFRLLRPYSIKVSYMNPLTNENNTDEFRCERDENRLKFLIRMIDLMKDKSRLAAIVKSNIVSRIKTKNESELEEKLIQELNSMTIDLDIDIK